MKRILFALTALTLAACLAACASPEAAASPSPAPSATVSETAAATATSPADYEALGFDLMDSETLGDVKLGMTESELIAKLGKPDKQSDAEVWGADGLKHADWTYTALGLTINMSESANPESEFVSYSISAEAPCALATAKGVKIGDGKDAVITAYGYAVQDQSDEGTKDSIVAGSVYGGVIFDMTDGKVTSIFIGAAAE